MAKITCIKSGVIFSCEHMPVQSQCEHPLFSISQKRLIALAGSWSAGKLSSTESYLLYLALLDSTELIQWRNAASYHAGMDQIVANNMEHLLHIIAKINLIKHPSFTLPSFAIGPDTHNLSNSFHWIKTWISNYREWYESYLDSRAADELRTRIQTREESLQRLIKSSTHPDAYASTLADWAATAGAFPTSTTPHPISKQPISISDYWKQIIRTIANEDKLWRFPRADIVELIEHCEDNIVHGTIYSHKLMAYLRSGLRKYDDYLGFGTDDITTGPTSFTIMPARTSIQEINTNVLLNTAPIDEPKKSQYPNNFAWLKAYSKWKLAQSIQHNASKT